VRFGERNTQILWSPRLKTVPVRPDTPEQYDVTDRRHWFDHEFASLTVEKASMPDRPAGGSAHKYVVCICPTGPYMDAYTQTMSELARESQIQFEIIRHPWAGKEQHEQIVEALTRRPDMMIVVPVDADESETIFRTVHDAGIPLIVGNMMPEPAAYRYVVAWTGPDVWEESRRLAREFAVLMNYDGGYCMLRHVEKTSTFCARTYGFMCELSTIAPGITLLDSASSNLETSTTYRITEEWIRRYGDSLKGIVSCDDELVLPGVVEALESTDTHDIVVVSNGCTRVGLSLLAGGSVQALTYKPPELDGRLAMEAAIDWLNGLDVPPAMFLPVHIVTPEEARSLLRDDRHAVSVPISQYREAVRGGNLEEIHSALDAVFRSLLDQDVLRSEFLYGVMMRLVGVASEELSAAGIGEASILGSYEDLFKFIALQRSVDSSITWMRQLSERVLFTIHAEQDRMSRGERILQIVNTRFSEPLSLKSIAADLEISPAHAGRLFRKQTGTGFSDYLMERRIREAQHLLLNTSLPASEVARLVGFTSRNYFYTAFGKRTGVTPSQFADLHSLASLRHE